MKNISKIAVLMMAVLISVTAYGQKFYKRIIWDAKITCAKFYPYIPKIDYTHKTLDFYETPPANIILDLGTAAKDTRNYEFHNIRDEFAMRNKKSWFNADTLDYSMIETSRRLTCKIIKCDTLVIKVNDEPVTKCKLSEYVAKAPIHAKMAWLKTHQDQFAANRRAYLAAIERCKRHNAKMQAEYEKDSVVAANSLAVYKRAIEDQQKRQEQEREAHEAAKEFYATSMPIFQIRRDRCRLRR